MSISKCRRYSIWTGIIVITAVICLSVLGVCSTAEPREREGNTTWIKKNHNKWAYIYNELPMEKRHKRFSAVILLGTKGSDCDVIEDRFKGLSDDRNVAVWVVRCSNGDSYIIMILPNKTTYVATCERFHRVTGGNCF